ncbi:MAG: hypothetical protein P4N24_01930 [Acidobacteriota bacterium]|nr:hypothetical protein [Acidobacteriota bacterium]
MTVVITGQDSKLSANGHRRSAQPVEGLLAALDEPPLAKPSLENCGIDSNWLSSNAEPGLRGLVKRKLTPTQIAFFRSRFTDVPLVQQVFERDYAGFHTDDYPEMSVSILRDGKKDVLLHSGSQNLFMLPWEVQGGSTFTTFNCHISQALAALLPAGVTNRGRLVRNDYFRWKLTEGVMQAIENDWDMLDTHERIGRELAAIETRFTLSKSQIAGISSTDVGDWKRGERGESWNAELEEKGLPPNMRLGVSLPYHDGRLVGADQFLAQINNYEALVLSVPWLTQYMKRELHSVVELRYVNDHSLSHKALSALAEDLKGHGKGDIADRVIREGSKSAFLIIDGSADAWSTWVVFPNREMLLWSFRGDDVLQWKGAQFDSWDYYGWRGAGTMIEPDGTLSR